MNRRKIALSALFVASLLIVGGTGYSLGQAQGADPTVVAADQYSVILENDAVRVLRSVYGPEEASEMHHHPALVVVYLADAHVRFTGADGESEEVQGSRGDVIWIDSTDHAVENLGEAVEVILVEIKGH